MTREEMLNNLFGDRLNALNRYSDIFDKLREMQNDYLISDISEESDIDMVSIINVLMRRQILIEQELEPYTLETRKNILDKMAKIIQSMNAQSAKEDIRTLKVLSDIMKTL